MNQDNEIDRRFVEAYSDACASNKPETLYKAMERMHDEFAKLLRLYRSPPKRESICRECKGTGADPLSDNLNSLPCRSCGGKS